MIAEIIYRKLLYLACAKSTQKVEAKSRASISADIIEFVMNDLSSGTGRLPTAA